MKRLLSILLALVMIVTPMTGIQESYAVSYDFTFAYEATTVTASTDVELKLQLTQCEGTLTAVTFANVLSSLPGFTVKGVKAGDLVSASSVSYESDFDSIALSNINVSSTGTLLVLTVKTPAAVGTVKVKPDVGYSTYSNAPNYGKILKKSTNIVVEKNTSTKPTHTVTFNANSGAGGPGALSGEEGTTVTIPSTAPEKANFVFQGWAESAQSSVAAYKPGDTLSLDRDYLFYAVWKANDTALLIYNANGKTLTSGLPDSTSFTKGGSVILSSVKPSAAGYAFLGWSANASDTKAAYAPGSAYTFNSDVTLYAIWELITYSITYDANGGQGAPDRQTKIHGTDITLNTVIPTRTGYTFAGWATSKTAESSEYAAGAKYTKNENVTLYAVWADKVYTVTYDANGGANAPTEQTKVHDKDLAITDAVPTRDGYTFEGWATKPDSTEVTYRPGDFYKSNAITTLYAIWKLETYTVSFDANGGENAPAAITKTRTQNISIPAETPSREGYIFQGWATSADGAVAYNPSDAYGTEGNATLYAVWQLKTYTVKYNANGGNPTPAEQVKKHFEALTVTTEVPTRSGYKFIGWSTNSAATTAEYASGAQFTTEANTELFAVWERSTYTVKFDANGGTNAPASITKTRGVDITLSFADNQIPTRNGYLCLGWATNKSATSPMYDLITDKTYKVDADVTLYALWIKNPYTDINPAKWSARYAAYIYYRGAMTGKNATFFGLNDPLTKGQFATILYRIQEEPDVDTSKNPFKDVLKNNGKMPYYYAPVIWAKNTGVVTGENDGSFKPGKEITRQEFMIMLYRFARDVRKINVTVGDANAYKAKADAKNVSSWAREAVNWGYVNGFIGNGSDLAPRNSIKRSEAATMIARFLVKYGI